MMTRKLFFPSFLAALLVLGASLSLAGVNGPGPQSIRHYSKLNLKGLLGEDDEDKAAAQSSASEVEVSEAVVEESDGVVEESESVVVVAKPEVKAEAHPAHGASSSDSPLLFVAVIEPTDGNDAEGVVYFAKTADGVKVWGTIEGLTPGNHGFHVHEYGDVSAGDGTSAGGHFNPGHQPHAGPGSKHRHVGDLGNVTANEEGVAEFSFIDTKLGMEGPTSILGRGLIVHEGADDLTSQPTGNAGPRVGMAVIGWANPEDLEE